MNRTVLILLVSLLWPLAAFAQGSDLLGLGRDYSAQRKPDPIDGRFITIGGIFGGLRVGCVQCHGSNGQGDTSGAFPRLAGQGSWYLYKSLRDYAGGVRRSDIMGPIARQLSDSKMQNVAAYYASIAEASPVVAHRPDIEIAQVGGAIAAVGVPEQGVPACESCHARTAGMRDATVPSLDGQYANYLEHQLTLWREGRRGGDAMNVMEQIAKRMTTEQTRAVALYYSAVDPTARDSDREASILPKDNAVVPARQAPTGAAPPYLEPQQSSGRPNRTMLDPQEPASTSK